MYMTPPSKYKRPFNEDRIRRIQKHLQECIRLMKAMNFDYWVMEFEATEHAIEEDFKEEAAFYKKFGVTSDEFFDLIDYLHDDRMKAKVEKYAVIDELTENPLEQLSSSDASILREKILELRKEEEIIALKKEVEEEYRKEKAAQNV